MEKTLEFGNMTVGTFGLDPSAMEQLKKIFKSVEIIRASDDKHFDLRIVDISYASSRIFAYIKRNSPMPMVLTSRYERNFETLKCLDKDSYLVKEIDLVDSLKDEATFKKEIEEYIAKFETNKEVYKNYMNAFEEAELAKMSPLYQDLTNWLLEEKPTKEEKKPAAPIPPVPTKDSELTKELIWQAWKKSRMAIQ